MRLHWCPVFTAASLQHERSDNDVQVKQTQLRTQPCFLEFLAQGARLSLMFAVDFSECNPEPSHPSCMHHFPQGDASACEQVLGCTADLVSVSPDS